MRTARGVVRHAYDAADLPLSSCVRDRASILSELQRCPHQWRIAIVKLNLLVAIAVAALPITSSALECQGTVASVGVQSDGSLVVQLAGGQPHYVCNVVAQNAGGSWKMDPISCRAALSTLLAARTAATPPNVVISYTGTNAPATCSAITLWSLQVTASMIRTL